MDINALPLMPSDCASFPGPDLHGTGAKQVCASCFPGVQARRQAQAGNEAGKSEVLLAAFERPPQATGDTVNSAVVIASESAASYPGLKQAQDYLGPLTELATAKGFKAEGEPYALEVESRHLFRADFIKPLRDNDKSKLTMHQCTLVLLTKGHLVSFTFIAGSEDDLDDLMDALHFTN